MLYFFLTKYLKLSLFYKQNHENRMSQENYFGANSAKRQKIVIVHLSWSKTYQKQMSDFSYFVPV